MIGFLSGKDTSQLENVVYISMFSMTRYRKRCEEIGRFWTTHQNNRIYAVFNGW